jgi:hypothetical protein
MNKCCVMLTVAAALIGLPGPAKADIAMYSDLSSWQAAAAEGWTGTFFLGLPGEVSNGYSVQRIHTGGWGPG